MSNQSMLVKKAFYHDKIAPLIQCSNQSLLFERAFRQNTKSRRTSAEQNSSDAQEYGTAAAAAATDTARNNESKL